MTESHAALRAVIGHLQEQWRTCAKDCAVYNHIEGDAEDVFNRCADELDAALAAVLPDVPDVPIHRVTPPRLRGEPARSGDDASREAAKRMSVRGPSPNSAAIGYLVTALELRGSLALPCQSCRREGIIGVHDLHAALAAVLPPQERLAQCLDRLTARASGILNSTNDRYRTGVADGLLEAVEAIERLGAAVLPPQESYQQRVRAWVLECFGPTIANDMTERSFRFLEEALELSQSIGCTREQAHTLVDYVFNRPTGERGQEVGGVLVTLAALVSAAGIDMDYEAERELVRITMPETIAKIRRKQASKRDVVSHAAQAALPGQWSEGSAVLAPQQEKQMETYEGMKTDNRTFYGPHPCEVCGALIAKAARDDGGVEFDYPEGIIYPNTTWRLHVHQAPLADSEAALRTGTESVADPSVPNGGDSGRS